MFCAIILIIIGILGIRAGVKLIGTALMYISEEERRKRDNK